MGGEGGGGVDCLLNFKGPAPIIALYLQLQIATLMVRVMVSAGKCSYLHFFLYEFKKNNAMFLLASTPLGLDEYKKKYLKCFRDKSADDGIDDVHGGGHNDGDDDHEEDC